MKRPATKATAPELEVEAKFLVRNVADLTRIGAVQRIGPHRLRPRERARLRSVYFDTAELSLLRERVSLRLRNKGGRFEATAKWMGKVRGSLHERPELNVALASAPRGAFTLPEGALHERLCATVAGRKLAPILITDIERRVIDAFPRGLASGVPVAELALDHVRLLAPGRPAQLLSEYAEVELQLRSGSRQELTALGRRLQRAFGLIAASESKFGRGLALRFGRALPRERPTFALVATDTVESAARKVIAGLLSRMREHDPATRRGDDAEALHQLRVAVRRARAALRTFEDAWPEAEREAFGRELRWLGGQLGAVRDLDVQLEALDTTTAQAPPTDRRALAHLRADLAQEREAQRAKLDSAMAARRYFRLMIALERFAHARGRTTAPRAARSAIVVAGGARVERALEKLDKRGRKLLRRKRPPSAEELHALRIRAKRARYALEFLSDLTGKPGKRLVKRLVELQDLLGSHQDAVVAAERIARFLERRAVAAPGGRSSRVFTQLIAQHGANAARARDEFAAMWKRWSRREREALPYVLRKLSHARRRAPSNGVAPVQEAPR